MIKNHPDGEALKKPIYAWLPDLSHLEEGCMDQALNLTQLPFAFKHIALMPDTHQGFGMPIGGVLAVKEHIIPNAVGVDIGCGVAFTQTSLPLETITHQLLSKWVEEVLHKIPQGFSHHQSKQKSFSLDGFQKNHVEEKKNKLLWREIDKGYYQIGTLGGGNHFIEFQEDEKGYLCLMVHSGSRNFGYQIARYFNDLARNNRKNWGSVIPKRFALDYIPEKSEEGKSYISWMNLARDFARENRAQMMRQVLGILSKNRGDLEIMTQLDVHHNDVNREHHDNEWVWVHRKGAIRAGEDEAGIIPGAMGRNSYIVVGKGNRLSFQSCSHGAGRSMSRKQALRLYSPQEVKDELDGLNMILGKKKMKDVGEEAPMAYKDIDFVMEQQADLVKVVSRLTGKAVIKG